MSNLRNNDYGLEVAMGNKAGVEVVHKFGSNHAVTTSLVPITKGGVMQMVSALTSLEMVSSDNVNDKAGGTGALTVTVEGLGTGWTELSETVTLNGTTAVALSNQYFRVNRISVATSGSYANPTTPSHNSTITLRTASVGATWVIIEPENGFGLGQSQQGIYTVPSGKTAFLMDKDVTVEASKPTTIFFFVRDNADDVSTPYTGVMRVKEVEHGLEAPHGVDFPYPQGPFVGPCDIGFMAVLATGTGEVGIDFSLVLTTT